MTDPSTCTCAAVVLDSGHCDGCGAFVLDPGLAWIWNHPPAEEVVAGLQRAAEQAIRATSAVPGYSPISPRDGNDATS